MLEALYVLNALLMLSVPLVALTVARKRLRTSWKLLGAGALTFFLSQVVHIPLNLGVAALFRNGVLPRPPDAWLVWLLPLALGLSAGLCEEIARYVGYRRMTSVRSFEDGVGYGIGHGGFEALLVALLALVQLVNLFVLRSMDLSTLPLPPEQAEVLAKQIADAWSAPPWQALAGTWERVFALLAHVSMSVFVLQAFRRGIAWLFVAIGAHTLLDAVAVYFLQRHGLVATEIAIAVVALSFVGLAAWLRRSERA